MKKINEDLKTGNWKQVYLLFGEEEYLKKQYRDKLIQALAPEPREMNYSYYEGKDISVGAVIDTAETLPFFADSRLIVIENSGWFKKQEGQMADYLATLPETTRILFVEKEVDKRGRLYKAVSKVGYSSQMERQEEGMLLRWVGSKVSKEGKTISLGAQRRLLERSGNNMEQLEKEIEKLICYRMDEKTITEEDVESVTTWTMEDRIFSLIEAVTTKNRKKALEDYYELLALKEPPMKILSLLNSQFRRLLETLSLRKMGMQKEQIAKELGVHPYAASKYMQQSGRYTKQELRGILEEGADLEERVKTGRIADRTGVELFIVKYSSP